MDEWIVHKIMKKNVGDEKAFPGCIIAAVSTDVILQWYHDKGMPSGDFISTIQISISWSVKNTHIKQ